jgi:hypothetical protein
VDFAGPICEDHQAWGPRWCRGCLRGGASYGVALTWMGAHCEVMPVGGGRAQRPSMANQMGCGFELRGAHRPTTRRQPSGMEHNSTRHSEKGTGLCLCFGRHCFTYNESLELAAPQHTAVKT